MQLLIVVVALLSFSKASPHSQPIQVGLTTKTSSGPVIGHAAVNYPRISEYLGIPYAQAPVGQLRFAAPVEYTGSALINGSSFGSSCPQIVSQPLVVTAEQQAASNITSVGIELFNMIDSLNTTYSEDCLFLNIWSNPQSREAKKAVMVFIHGGGFTGGTSSMPVFNGAALADKGGIIVVTLNYRLSILGFPGNPSAPSNLALLDQRLAIEWVRDNIASFGGDSSRITLFGQSAGAASVDYLTYGYPSDPIASSIILQSGTVFSFGLPYPKDTIAANWYTVTSSLNCGNASSSNEEVMTCMRSIPTSILLAAIPNTGINAFATPFGPTIDDVLVFANYSLRTPANIPAIVGSNHNEAGSFRTQFALQGVLFEDEDWDEYTAASFTCPAALRADASPALASNSKAKSNLKSRAPVWRYRYHAVFPNTNISSEGGAYHGAELTLLFGTESRLLPQTAQEGRFATYMQGAWVAFGKDPVRGLGRYDGWPRYVKGEKTLLRLGWEERVGTNVVVPALYDEACETATLGDLYCRLLGYCV